MKDVVVAGCCILDVIKEIDVYPQPTSLAKIHSQRISVGGALCNTGIDLKKLNEKLNIKTIGVLGNDTNGDFVLKTLQDNKIDVSLMRRVDTPTGFTDVISEASGRRTFFHNQGANDFLNEEDFVTLDSSNTELVHIGYLLLLGELDKEDDKYGTKMAKLLSSLQKRGIKTSIDVVSEDSERFSKIVIPSLKYCNYVIINEFEAGKVVGINPRNADNSISLDNIKKILIKLKNFGVKNKAIIHCPELGAMIDENNKITIATSLILPDGYIKGSVGAGDAFAAGCLYGVLHNYTNEEILRLASCASAKNLSAIDSISGATDEKETMKLEKIYHRYMIKE